MIRRTIHLTIWVGLMLTFLCVGVSGCGKTGDTNASPSDAAPVNAVKGDSAQGDSAKIDKVVVYYFHNTRRCATCMGIQQAIEDTIDDSFSKDVDAGMLDFKELNMEEAANKKLVDQFQLSFGTMIVAAEAGGKTRKFENAGKVWELAQSPVELRQYIEKSIRNGLNLFGRFL